MKSKILLTLFSILLLPSLVFAACDVMVNGKCRIDADIIEYDGLTAQPAVSPSDSARIYFDTLTGKLMCSEDGGAYVQCTAAGGSGDNLSVNSSAVTDLNFIDGDIDFTLNTVPNPDEITATVACTDCVDATDLKDTDTPADEECLTYEATGTTFEWQACGAGGGDNVSIDSSAVVDPDFVSTGQIDFTDSSNTITADINADAIVESDLKAVNSPTDEFCLTYETTTGDFEWEACGAGATSLEDLTDVGTSTATNGNILVANGTLFNAQSFIDSTLTIYDGIIVGEGANEAKTIALMDRAGTDAIIAWDETNDEFDFNYPINVSGGDSFIIMAEVSTAPTTVANEGAIYTKLSGGQTELFFREESNGDEVQITQAGAVSADLDDLTDVGTSTATAGNVLIADGTDFDSAVLDLASGSDGDSSTSQSDSGLEVVAGFYTLLRGCTDDQILKWDETQDDWNCEADAGAAGGDNVSIDSAAVTDPDFVSTGQIDFTDSSNTVTADINDNSILEADLKAVDTAVDEECLTYESTTGDFEWQTCCGGGGAFSDASDPIVQNTTTKDVHIGDGAGTLTGKLEIGGDADQPQLVIEGHSTQTDDIFIIQNDADTEVFSVSNTGAFTNIEGALSDDTILEADLKAVDAAVDEECLTYESTTGDFEWQTCGSGSDTNSVKEYYFNAAQMLALEAGDSIPPLNKDEGTNVDRMVLDYDAATDECRAVEIKVPSDVESGSTITFRAHWYSGTATTGNIIWDARHTGGDTEGESWDSALTTEAAAADATQGTVDQITVTTWTETLANTGWAANDNVQVQLCRDANNASDTLVGDASLIGFGVEIPRE